MVDKQQKLQSFLVRKDIDRALIGHYIVSTRQKLISSCIVINLENIFYVCKRSIYEYVTM